MPTSTSQLERSRSEGDSAPESGLEQLWWAVAPWADALARGEREARHLRLLDSIGDGVSVTDPTERCLYVNPAAAGMLGGTVPDLIGRNLARFEFAGPRPADGALATFEALPANGPPGWRLLVTKGAYQGDRGEPLGWVTVARAIPDEMSTGLAERVSALEESVRAREELLAVASHELSTPLSALRLQLEILLRAARQQRSEPCPGWVVERISGLEKSVKRLGRQVVSLLDFSQVRAGKMVLQVEQMDLCATAKEVITRYAEELVEAGCALEFHAPSAVMGEWDPVRIEQVITNLLVNALKFGRGHPVVLRLEEREGSCLLHVSDHGPGIPEAEHERIFQRFERATRAGRMPGFGLGLTIAKAIVEAHHGRISLTSAPGRGARFTVTLPRAHR